MNVVALGLGSNLGNRLLNLRTALRSVEKDGMMVLRSSDVFETEPWGVTDQPYFLNACLLVQSEFAPETMLGIVKEIEQKMGRAETGRWRERIVDIDILFMGACCYKSPVLQIPHAAIQDRCFVLVPLAQVAPDWTHPVTKRTAAEMASHCHEMPRICRL